MRAELGPDREILLSGEKDEESSFSEKSKHIISKPIKNPIVIKKAN